MSAGKILNTSNALYSNIVRALSGDLVTTQLRNLLGGSDTALQPGGVVIADAVSFSSSWTAIQGIAINATNWFAIDTTALRKYDLTGTLLTTSSTPFAGMPAGLDHCGDGFADNSFLYVPISNYVSATQTATTKVLAKFNVSDLSLHSYFDLSAIPSDFNASGVCLSPDSAEFLCTSYNTTDADIDSTTKIWRFAVSDGSYIGQHTLGSRVRGAQGIAYKPNANAIYITSWVSPNSRINTYDATAFSLLQILDPSNINSNDEIEGVICYQNEIYTHKINGGPLKLFRNMCIPANLTTGDPAQFLNAAQIGDAGTVMIHWRPMTLPTLQTVFDNQTNANTWETWCNNTGILSWRVTATTPRCDYTGIVAGTEYIIAMTWSKSGSNVDIKLGVNGIYHSSATQAFTAVPTNGLWLGGGNASNSQADAVFSDVLVFDKALSDSELLDSYTNFSGFYDAGGATTATVSYDIGQIDFAVSASALAPGSSASIAYDIGEIAFSASGIVTAPSVQASAAYDIGEITFSVSANAIPTGNVAIISYDIGAIGFDIAASSTVPIIQAALAFDIGAIDFAISGDVDAPVISANIGYDIGAVSFSVSANALEPTPVDIQASVSYDIGAIAFSITAIATSGQSLRGVGYGVQFTEPSRGFTFTEPPRGVQF